MAAWGCNSTWFIFTYILRMRSNLTSSKYKINYNNHKKLLINFKESIKTRTAMSALTQHKVTGPRTFFAITEKLYWNCRWTK